MRSKLLFVGAITVLFGLSVLVPKVRARAAPDSPYGNWMGVVFITRYVSDGTLQEHAEQQAPAVIHVNLSPVWFSYLDRTKSTATLIEPSGEEHTFAISDLADGWQLRTRWGAKQLLAAPPDETVTGQWNQSFSHFVLTFHGDNTEFPDGASYRITGSLRRGDNATLQSLTNSLRSTR